MPLPDPEARDWLQLRNIECRGYRRWDGLWEIEAHLHDLRSYTYPSRERGDRPAGLPVHDMRLRLTLDDNLEVWKVACSMDSTPMGMCREIESAYQSLVGLRIAPGWNRAVRTLLGGAQGCTHLLDLLSPIVGAAIQTIGGYREAALGRPDTYGRTPIVRCHALARKAREQEGGDVAG